MDSTFKRVPARRQLEDVSTRLSHLQRSLGLGQDHALSAATGTVYKTHAGLFLGDPEKLQEVQQRAESSRPRHYDPSPSSDEDVSGANWLHLGTPQEDGTWVIENVSLNTDTVLALFHHFDQYHWQHVQFMEPCTSIRDLYASAPFLFWTIILIASRKSGNGIHTDIHGVLQPHVQAMLASRVMDLKPSIKALHAMLILCIWPFPVVSQAYDSTWVLCGVAMNTAMMMGLHKPGHAEEYGRPLAAVKGDPYTRKMTWLAIFQISTSLTTWLGMPPPICTTSQLETITMLCRDASIPRAMRARAQIQRQVARYTQSLDEQIDQRTKHSLVKLFEQDLSHLPTDYSDVWSPYLELELLGVKLYLYGMSFVSTTAKDTQQAHPETHDVFTRDILQRGLATAVQLLSLVLPFGSKDEPHSTASPVNQGQFGGTDFVFQLSSYPKQFFLTVAFANFFLLWFLAVDPQASHTDRELARNYVSATYQFFISFTESPEHIRYGKTIEVLGRMPDLADADTSVRRNSRLGASFVYEIMRRAVYHREATRLASEAQKSSSGTVQPGYVALNNGSLPAGQIGFPHQREPSHLVPTRFHHSNTEGYAQGMDLSVQSAMEGLLPDPSMQVDQFALLTFEDAGDWDFPWGVWDDAAFDALGYHLTTTPPYGAESLPQ
ncbi:hypothetical protein MMC30_005024 [Trapelia coarctata]|nr:hypothetical protein [Trapelia coarctata]